MTPIELVRHALCELLTDEPLVVRVDNALECLNLLRSSRDLDPVIVGMINDACAENCLPKERREILASVIETIFELCN